MVVLVLTEPNDHTADRVRAVLRGRGIDHVQWDIGEFPMRLSCASKTGASEPWSGWITDGARTVGWDEIEAVYYRRPTEFRLPAHLSSEARRFALAEARHGFGGLLSTLAARWVSHPARIADASYKPQQLRVADEVGLRIPRTLITDP